MDGNKVVVILLLNEGVEQINVPLQVDVLN